MTNLKNTLYISRCDPRPIPKLFSGWTTSRAKAYYHLQTGHVTNFRPCSLCTWLFSFHTTFAVHVIIILPRSMYTWLFSFHIYCTRDYFPSCLLYTRLIRPMMTSRNGMCQESIFLVASPFNDGLSEWNLSSVDDMTNMYMVTNTFVVYLLWPRLFSLWACLYVWCECYYSLGGFPSLLSVVLPGQFPYYRRTSFMRNLSTWDVSSVADMRRMFSDVKALGGKISKWNVSNATTMDTMFTSDSSLNGDLSGTF